MKLKATLTVWRLNAVAWFWRTYVQLRFGAVTEETKAVDGGVVSECAFFDKNGVNIGYWAYGSYDPRMPYRGQDAR